MLSKCWIFFKVIGSSSMFSSDSCLKFRSIASKWCLLKFAGRIGPPTRHLLALKTLLNSPNWRLRICSSKVVLNLSVLMVSWNFGILTLSQFCFCFLERLFRRAEKILKADLLSSNNVFTLPIWRMVSMTWSSICMTDEVTLFLSKLSFSKDCLPLFCTDHWWVVVAWDVYKGFPCRILIVGLDKCYLTFPRLQFRIWMFLGLNTRTKKEKKLIGTLCAFGNGLRS